MTIRNETEILETSRSQDVCLDCWHILYFLVANATFIGSIFFVGYVTPTHYLETYPNIVAMLGGWFVFGQTIGACLIVLILFLYHNSDIFGQSPKVPSV